MKKLYSFLFLAVISLLGFGASAKTLTLKATADGAVYFVEQSSGSVTEITTAGVSVTFAEDGPLVIKANSGWLISAVKGTVTFDYASQPTDDISSRGAVTYPLADGSEVLVEVVDASSFQAPSVVLRGDKDAFYASYNYQTLYPDANGEIKISEIGSGLSIFANDGYKLVSAVSDKGDTFSPQGTYIYVYTGIFNAGETVISVETVDLSQVETSTFTAEVVGTSYKCYFYDQNYNYYYFNSDSQTISFSEGDIFTLSSQYGALYKVELNGETVATSWTSYRFTPAPGDQMTIYTEFPDVDVDFSMAFADGCDAGIVKEFRYDNSLLDASVWNSGSWAPKFGKTLNMTLNTADYADVKMTVNGVETTIGYGGSVSFALDSEECHIEISGTRQSGFNVTVIVSDPDNVTVYKGYSYYGDVLALDGVETELELSRAEGSAGLQFVAASGYRIAQISVIPEPTYAVYGNMVYVDTDGTVIEVEVEKINRDNALSLFVGPGKWNYGPTFSMGNNDNDFRREFNLTEGYTVVDFCDEDVELGVRLGGYPTPIVYINGVQSENVYGDYTGLNALAHGDVVKIFQSTPDTHSLSYEIGENVNISVVHDRVQSIDFPGNHSVFTGTEVSLIPMATLSDEAEAPVTVIVNDANIQPVDGVYTFTVNSPTKVSVKVSETVGVENVSVADDADAVIYNLQGVRLDTTADRLPSGIYIINGRKVRK